MENYTKPEQPEFVERMIAHLDTSPGKTVREEIKFDESGVNYLICASETEGIQSVLVEWNPEKR